MVLIVNFTFLSVFGLSEDYIFLTVKRNYFKKGNSLEIKHSFFNAQMKTNSNEIILKTNTLDFKLKILLNPRFSLNLFFSLFVY